MPATNPANIEILPDAAALHAAAVKEVVACAKRAITAHRQFFLALSGGNTPRNVYSLLAEQSKDSLPWEKIHIFFGDERHVPPDDPESNYRMARESLLSKVPIPEENVHRIAAELPAPQAADRYEQELKSFFHLSGGAWPRFDLILLGIGEEGHTASLFPGTTALGEQSRLAAANWVEKLQTWRITLTYPVLNHAAEVLFLVSGQGKAQILRDIFDPSKANLFPAQAVHPLEGKILWLADRQAASLL
jgi:6-phosphogluconolactonase